MFKLGNFPVSVPEGLIAAFSTVFPNPADDQVTITGRGLETGMMLLILDASGRIVACEQATASPVQIDVSALPKGVYTVRCDGHAELGRFMKH